MSARFIIEGEWSGYTSRQQRVVHRSVHLASEKKLRAWAEKTSSILYTDGTRLLISVRDCKPRERVEQRPSYASLIRECVFYDVDTVQATIDAEQARRKQREGSAA